MNAVGRVLRARWSGWLPIALGVGLRLYWALSFDPNPVNDGKWYFAQAQNIAAGLGYHVDGRPTAYWPVGYPALLGLCFRVFGTDLLVMRLMQVVLAAITLISLQFITRQLTGSVFAARFACLAYALYPTDIAYTSIMLSELSFNTWMLAGTAIGLSQARWPIRIGASGALFALAALTRPQGLLLPLWLGLFGNAPSRRGARARLLTTLGLCAAMSLALSPWWIRNALAFEAFVPVSNNGGVNLFIGNNPRAHGAYRLNEKVVRGGRAEYESDREFGRRAREYIAANPERTRKLWPRKLQKLLEDDVAPIGWSRSMAPDKVQFLSSLGGSMKKYYLGLWVLGLPGIVLGLRWLAAANVLAVIAFTLAFFGDFRFHHAIMPWLAIGAGSLVGQLVGLVARLQRRTAEC